MQVISANISNILQNASWIRRMFEAGIELKQKYGADKVCDFTLGNPDLPPVPEVGRTLRRLADTVDQPLSLGYMPNAGLTSTRQRLAEYLAQEQQVPLTAGAGHCHVRGRRRAERHLPHGSRTAATRSSARPRTSWSTDSTWAITAASSSRSPPRLPDFSLDLKAIEAAITDKTRIVLIDSPEQSDGRGVQAARAEGSRGRPDPRRRAGETGPSTWFPMSRTGSSPMTASRSRRSCRCTRSAWRSARSPRACPSPASASAISPSVPRCRRADLFIAGLILCNRILGYVNAPVIGQRLVEAALGATVDVGIYKKPPGRDGGHPARRRN